MAITFQVGFVADTKGLRASLGTISSEIQKAFSSVSAGKGMSDDIAKAVTQAQILEKTLKAATTDKGISFLKLNSELQKAGTSAEELVATLSQAGPAFSGTLNTFLQSFAQADRNLISLNGHLKEMQRVMTQSIKFTAAQQIQQFVVNQIQEAIRWTRQLNDELTTIAIVSGKTATQMEQVYQVVIDKSKELRVSAQDYAEAAQIFYQQGVPDDEVIRRSDITIKAAQAAGQSTQEMSQQLTAVWNTYRMQGEELERAASVGAKMGAETAVEFKDIATAMQISASAAAQMNVEYDMLAAIIATVGDTTQQSASVIGNAYKTIFSRFNQLVSTGTDGEVTLGRVSQQLADLGVQILDSSGDLLPLGETIMDLGNRWDEYSQKQQIALAEAIGGTRQFGQVLALFNNWDKFMENYQSAQSEVGGETLTAQYEQSLNSIDSAMTNAAESWARAFSEIFESDAQIEFYRTLEAIGNTFEDMIDTAGGLKGILLLIASIAMRQLIPAFEKAKASFTTMMANRTLETQQASIAKSFEQQRAGVAAANNIGYTGNNQFDTDNATEQQIISNQYAQQKLTITQQVAQQMAIVNRLEQSSSAEVRNKAEGEKQVLQLLHQQSLEAVDLLQSNQQITAQLERQQKAAQARAERMSRNASSPEEKQQARNAQREARARQAGSAALSAASIVDSSSIEKTQKQMMGLSSIFGRSSDAAKEFQKEIMSVGNALKNTSPEEYGVELQRVSDAFQAMADSGELTPSMKAFAEQMATGFSQAASAQDRLINNNSRLAESQTRLNQLYSSAKTAMAGFGQSMMNTLSAVSTLAMSFSSLWSMIESGDVSLGGIITTLSIGIPSLVSFAGQIQKLGSSFATLVSSGATWAASLTAQAAAETAAAGATQSHTLATGLFNIAKKLKIVQETADTAATAAQTGATTAQTGATTAATAATWGLNAALSPVLVVVLLITAAIIALIAIIWAVVAAFKAWQASTPEGKLKAAEENAAALNTQLEETKTRVEEVQAAFEEYNSVTDTLDNCVKGTEEWKEALRDVNNQVIELLQQFPELATMTQDGEKAITRTADGQLQIADWAQDRILAEQDAQLNAAQGAAYAGQQQVRAARANVQRANLESALYDQGGGMSISDAVLGGIGSMLNPFIGIATALKGISSIDVAGEADVIAKNAEELSGLVGEELNTKLAEIFDNAGISADIDKWAGIIEGMGSDFTELTAAIQANTEATNIENQQMADQIMADSGYDNSTAGSMALEAGGEIYGQLQQQAYEKYMNTDMADWLGVGTSEGKAMWADYANAMGISDLDGYRVTNYRKDGGVEYEYIDESGQKQTGEATREMIASTLAAADAAEQLEGHLSELRGTIADLNASANAYDRAMAAFLSEGNFEGASVGELDSIREQVGFQDTTGLEGEALTDAQNANKQAVTDYVNSALGGEDGVLSDEEAQAMGYESANAFIEAFTEGLDVDIELPSGLGEGIADQLSVGASKAINDTYEKMGEEGGQAYLDTLQTIYDSVDWSSMTPEEAQQAWDQIANIDWSNMDAANQAAQIVRNLGGEIDTTTDAWKNNVTAIQDAMDATYDVASEMEKMAAAAAIVNDLEINGIISDEDYQTLVKYNEALADYFITLADGTHQMIGDPLDLQQEMQKSQQEKYKDMIKNTGDLLQEEVDQYAAGIAALGGSADNLDQYRDTENYVGEDGKNYYKGANVQTQLDFLASQGYDQEQLDAWALDLEDGKTTTKVLEDIAKAVDETGNSFNASKDNIAAYNAQLLQLETSYALTASSAEERKAMLESGEIGQDAYNAASLAAINEEKWEGLDQDDVEAVQNYADHLQDVADESELVSEELETNEEAAEDVARTVTKMNKGIEDLAEGYEDWADILENSDKASQEYNEAMDDMKSAMSNVLGVSEDFLSDDFILDNLEDIKLAAEGDAEAIDRLAIAAGRDIIMHLDIEDEGVREKVLGLYDNLATQIPDIKVGATVDTGDFLATANEIIQTAGMTAEEANALFSSMGFQANFKTEPQPVLQRTPIVHTRQTIVDSGEDENGAPYWETTTETWNDGYSEQWGEVDAIAMTTSPDGTEVPVIESLTRTSSGAMNNYSDSNAGGGSPGGGGGKGGGGGSAPEHKAKKAEKRDSLKVEDRYSTVQAAIDDVQRSLDKLDDTSSDMWGGPKLKALQKYNQELWNQADNYQTLLGLTEHYMEVDQEAANKTRGEASKELGATLIGIEFNDDGFIANRTEIINQLDDLLQAKYDEYKTAADAYDAAQSTNEAESERIDKLKEDYDELEKNVNEYIEALDLSDETAQKHQDTLNELVEMIRKEISNRVEIITYKIELQTDMNDLEMEQIERTIEHLGDVGVLTGEKIHLLSGAFKEAQQNASLAVSGFRQLEGLLGRLNTEAGQAEFIEKFGQEAWDQYAENGVLPEEIVSEMQSYVDSLMSSIDEMYSKMEDMFDTYLDLLDMYADKFDQIADKLSNNASKLDVYQELLEFSGQQYRVEDDGTHSGQEARRRIAAGRVSTTQANLENAKQQYDLYKEQYDEWMQNVEKFQDEHGHDIANYDEATAAAWNKIEETRQELYNQMQDAESEIYDNMSELVSNVADAIETGAQIITEQIVESLGGLFDSFESMTETWDQMETVRTFFLEDYDKNYQLESLLRDVDDAMADVTDPARMNEYLALIDEINAANAEGVKVTQNDVDLLKAKFELQKAQDAYEEAQNAKNTMRLARDASGNWSYVYSQDQSQSQDAAQALADAQYNYDKLLHEVRDESSQLWLQTQQEFFEWQQTIDQSRLQWDTAYKEQVKRTYDYYIEMTGLYADQVEKYNGLLGESYSETTLGIITNYDSMDEAQSAYTQKHEEYNYKLEENTKEWEDVMDEECKKVGLDYGDLAKDVTDAANNIISENTKLEGDVKNLKQVASDALGAMSKNVWDNVNSMIRAIQALEAELQRAIALLQQLTQDSLGYDEGTDYSAYLTNDYMNYGGSKDKDEIRNWLDTYHYTDVLERMNAGDDRDIFSGKTYEEAADMIVDHIYNRFEEGAYDGWNFGGQESGKELIDYALEGMDQIYNKDKEHAATGGLFSRRTTTEIAENGPELVLNADDTKNILAAVSQMREVVKMKMSNLNGNLGKQTAGVTEKTIINKDIQQVEQAVHIDATFPNVSVAKEIEEAFSNLVNQAVQYASQDSRRH